MAKTWPKSETVFDNIKTIVALGEAFVAEFAPDELARGRLLRANAGLVVG